MAPQLSASVVCVVDTEFVKVRGRARLATLSIVPLRNLTLPGVQFVLPEHNFYFNPWIDPETGEVAAEEMQAALKRPRNNVNIGLLSRSASFKDQLLAVASALSIYQTPLARSLGADQDCPIVVAHNARHDRDLLLAEGLTSDIVWVCSMRMLARVDALMPGILWPNSRTLSLGEWHKRATGGKTLFNAHDANADARALGDVLRSTLSMIVSNPAAQTNEAWSILALGNISEDGGTSDEDVPPAPASPHLEQQQQDSDNDDDDDGNNTEMEIEVEEDGDDTSGGGGDITPLEEVVVDDDPETVRVTMFVQKKKGPAAAGDKWKGLKTYQGKWLTASPFPTSDTYTTCVFEFDPKRIMTVAEGGKHTKLSEMYASGLYDAVEMGSGTSCTWRVFSPECIREMGTDAGPVM